jgi:hypothetical protein
MSILEVMIAFTLFVTCVVLLMSVWVTHAKGIELGQDQEVAANLCQMFMEQSLAQGFSCVPVASQPYRMTRTLRGQSYDSIFTYSVNITNTTIGSTAPMHRILVCNVTWQNSTGNHLVTMESNVAW